MTDLTCGFTGHRHISNAALPTVRADLEQTIRDLIEVGFTRFLTGGALGFDTMAAQAVLALKPEFPMLHLHLVLPCRDQAKSWPAEDVRIYEDIKAAADSCEYICDTYSQGCMFQRNRVLVDQCCLCVAYLNRSRGGTLYTVNYARKHGVPVLYLGERLKEDEVNQQLSLFNEALLPSSTASIMEDDVQMTL